MTEVLEQVRALRGIIASGVAEAEAVAVAEAVVACCTSLLESGEPATAHDLASEAMNSIPSVSGSSLLRIASVKTRALVVLGDLGSAIDFVDSFLESGSLDASLAPSIAILELHVWRGSALWQLNRTRDAVDVLERARLRLLQYPDSSALGWCAYQLAAGALIDGNKPLAKRCALEALVSARRSNESYLEAISLRLLSILDVSACRWGSARDSAAEASNIAKEEGYRFLECQARRGLALIALKRGRVADAGADAESIESKAIEVRDDQSRTYARLLAALSALHAGEFLRAHRLVEDFQGARVEASTLLRQSLLTTEFLGDIHLEQGQAAEALARYDEVWPKALALVPKGDIVAELRRRRAECYLLMNRYEDAHREALTGLDHCRELGDRYEEAATYRVLALSTAAIGKPSEAKKWFDQGFAYYDDIETPYEWGKLWMAYGDWLHGVHAGEYRDDKAALEAYVAAADHFERMGAQAKLAEANTRIAALQPPPAMDLPPGAPANVASARSPRPARKPRAQVELERRAIWAQDVFGLVTRNRGLLDLLDDVAKLSKSDTPILVLGESGTGKELVAEGVHRLSGRAGQFVALNCGAIPRDMIESELFGHVAGAFTGATRDKPGLFEACHNGTVFLDEIGEMSVDLQSRLLRFLERNEARRVGSNKNYSVDTRVVAATNRDRIALERGVGFRPDLYYRLAHAVIVLPPLRRRGDDVQVLVDYFIAEFARLQNKQYSIGDSARDRLGKHSWPGNVRQLRAVLRRAVLLSTPGRPIEADDLQLDAGSVPTTLLEEMEAAEKMRISEVLAQARGSRTEAAKALGMPRTTLINKMQRHGLM